MSIADLCACGSPRLPGRSACGRHGAEWDDEMADALERMGERRRAALALAEVFCANADAGDDAANDDLVQEMRRRMRER